MNHASIPFNELARPHTKLRQKPLSVDNAILMQN